MLRAKDRSLIARSETDSRLLVFLMKRACARVGVQLMGFNFTDTHGHVLIRGPRYHVGEAIRRFECAATQVLGVRNGFDRAYLKPVDSHSYLRTCHAYILGQRAHHQTHHDPLLVGSSVLELLGARFDDELLRAVRTSLPRVTRMDVLRAAGLESLCAEAVSVEPLGELGLPDLLVAALTALGLPREAGRRPGRLRAVAVHSVAMEVPARLVAQALECAPATVRSLRTRASPSEAVVVTVRRQSRLRERLRASLEAPLGAASGDFETSSVR